MYLTASHCLFFRNATYVTHSPIGKLAKFYYKKNRVFQGEIVINLFNIHDELRPILLLVKTAKKIGGTYAFFVL